MEAFDFAFGPMKEPELDGLRKLRFTGKIFHVFSPQDWKSQLRLIDGCYKGRQNMVSELLKVGAPDEISPLFTFRTVDIAHHPRVASWPLRALLEARLSGLVAGQQKERILQCQRLLNTTSRCRCIIPLVCFVLCKCNPCNGSFVKSSECGSACRYATRDGERWR